MFAITVDSNKYGIDSNIHVYYSQQKDMDEIDIKNFLRKKGYQDENIKIALNEKI